MDDFSLDRLACKDLLPANKEQNKLKAKKEYTKVSLVGSSSFFQMNKGVLAYFQILIFRTDRRSKRREKKDKGTLAVYEQTYL